jgi:hypothetical protein
MNPRTGTTCSVQPSKEYTVKIPIDKRRPCVRVRYKQRDLIARTTDHDGRIARVWVGNVCYVLTPWSKVEAAITTRQPLEVA